LDYKNPKDDNMKNIKIVCKACEGSGIYKGHCEQDSVGVICNDCKGTGCKNFNYTPFKEKIILNAIKRVYPESYGFIISDKDLITEKGELIPFSTAGCTYEEWLNGETPKYPRFLICPFRATGQEWKYKKCDKLLMGSINNCPEHPHKEKCWEEYDKNTILNIKKI
jgi:hypothetical protein